MREHGVIEGVYAHELGDGLFSGYDDIYRDGRPFVSIEQFLEDDYYMGRVAKDLYPDNRPDILDIFDPKNTYVEVILTGATSIGKTFLTCLGVCYIIGQIGHYLNPHRWLGGSPTSPIILINMSLSARKAKDIVFTRVKTMVDSSPFFRERFRRDLRLSDSLVWRLSQTTEDYRNRTGPLLIFKPGTGDSLSALGDDIYAGVGDELNFFRLVERSKRTHGEVLDPAQRLYDTISRRMKGRFSAGGLPLGKFFLLSSAQYPEDFIERRIAEARESGDLGRTIKLIRKSIWEAKRGVTIQGQPIFGGKTFRVEVGTSKSNSRVLDDYNRTTGVVSPKPGIHGVEGKILDFPVELWDDVARDVEGAVRDFGGEVTRAISPFFMDTDVIYQAESAELRHPWSREETTLEDGSSLAVEELFERDEKEQRWRPRRHPTRARYAHIDLATTNDSAGVAVVHVAGWKRVLRAGREYDEPVFEADLVLRVNPPAGGEIRFSRIRDIVFQLRNYGMFIRSVTYDSWQSSDSIQVLRANGFSADVLSVDKDLAPYNYLKDCYFDGRICTYRYMPLITELVQLERRGDKCDHPMNGSKDVSDALCGAVYGAFQHEARLSPSSIEARMPTAIRGRGPTAEEQWAATQKSAEEEMREFVSGNRLAR